MRLTKNLKKKKFFEIEFFLLAEKKLEITVLAIWLSALITITFAATSNFFFHVKMLFAISAGWSCFFLFLEPLVVVKAVAAEAAAALIIINRTW